MCWTPLWIFRTFLESFVFSSFVEDCSWVVLLFGYIYDVVAQQSEVLFGRGSRTIVALYPI